MKRFSFTVRIEVNDHHLECGTPVTRDHVKEHVETAVKRWGGGSFPEDVMWPGNISVEVI